MSFARYPAYKDSGVEWLGEVPEHWEIWKVAHAFGSVGSGTTPPSSEDRWYDSVGIPWVTTGELRENVITETSKSVTSAALEHFPSLRIHPAGSLVVAMYGATIGRLGILGVDAATNQACCVLSAPRHLDISFTYYWLQGLKQVIIDLFSTGGGQPNINQDIVSNLRIPAPELPEQRVITAFLDHETAKIDALVAEKEKLIELLKEKRQAVISHAVTKGLDPSVPMKDSGIEWLGEVPAHWTLKRIRYAAELNPSKQEINELDRSTEVSFLPMEAIGENGRIELDRTRSISEVETGYTYFRDGDVTVAKITPCFENGKGAVMCNLQHGIGFGTTELIVVRPQMQYLTSVYIDRIFTSRPFRLLGEASMYGAGGQKRVPDDFVRDFSIGLPPIEEQTAIAAFLDRETAKIDALIAEATAGTAFLQERRSALISAAVTGQIDVRGLAA